MKNFLDRFNEDIDKEFFQFALSILNEYELHFFSILRAWPGSNACVSIFLVASISYELAEKYMLSVPNSLLTEFA